MEAGCLLIWMGIYGLHLMVCLSRMRDLTGLCNMTHVLFVGFCKLYDYCIILARTLMGTLIEGMSTSIVNITDGDTQSTGTDLVAPMT